MQLEEGDAQWRANERRELINDIHRQLRQVYRQEAMDRLKALQDYVASMTVEDVWHNTELPHLIETLNRSVNKAIDPETLQIEE